MNMLKLKLALCLAALTFTLPSAAASTAPQATPETAQARALPEHWFGPHQLHKVRLEAGAERLRAALFETGAVVEFLDYESFAVAVVDEQAFGGRALLATSDFDFRDEWDRIALNGFVLDTHQPELTLDGLDPLLRYSSTEVGGLFADSGLYIIQFQGPPRDEWLHSLAELGARVIHAIPMNAFVVQVQPGRVAALGTWAETAREVQYAGALEPAFRIHPSLRALLNGEHNQPVKVTVQIVDGPGSQEALADLQLMAEELIGVRTVGGYLNAVARVHPAFFPTLALLESVFQIEPMGERVGFDEAQGQIVAGNVVGTGPTGPGYLAWLASRGFDSTQFTSFAINVVDDATSLDGHPDLPLARIAFNQNPTGQSAVQGGHGFLNAHIVGGFNSGVGAAFEDAGGFNYGLGIAPWARVGVTAIFGPGALNPTSFENSAYASGARISSNSWGYQNGLGGPIADYDSNSQEYDFITRDAQPGVAGNQEYLVIFAAGNDGPGSNSVSTPSTAKSVLTVGASENQRQTGSDGCGISNLGANNIADVISFSSRGPVNSGGGDGRWKPELIAPGTHIQAGVPQSNYNGTSVCNAFWPPGQTLYGWSSGTSHSTPAVAGGAALVRQWFQNQGLGEPSPAMIKGVLANSASYINGVGAGGSLPSNSQGMGRMDLGRAFDGVPRVFVDQSVILAASGASHAVNGTVQDPGQPLRVSLCWTDAPGSTIGAPYINNLDLTVTAGGATYRGNVFAGAFSQTGGTSDLRNNTESVFLPAGIAGAFSITVNGASIGGDGVPGNADSTDQDFALVIYNGSVQTGPVAPGAGFSGTPLSGNAPLVVSFADSSSGAPTSWSWDFGDGGLSSLQHPNHTYTTAGNYTVSLTVSNAVGSDNLTRVNYVQANQGPPAGQGFKLSTTPDFAIDTRDFAPTDTLHMLVFDDVINLSNTKKAQWQLFDSNGRDAKGNFSATAQGTLTSSLALSGLPSSSVSWTWEAEIEDASGNKFQYAAPITISAGGPVPPTADFGATPTGGPAPLVVNFSDQSTGAPTAWIWNFGDGATSTLQNPQHSYALAGNYTVSLTATNAGGNDTLVQPGMISVLPSGPTPPTAGFGATPTSGQAPLLVNFSDTSTGTPTSWAWSFGDGATSTLQNPQHSYALAGNYTVSLTATNAGGNDTLVQPGMISVLPSGPTPP
ncbi:MAG TPA: PKD domain-containing protein, partial [Planctomycetes bacterium]|nr:PKD domain-containing protein [Planctomycetota bacterium]